MNRTEIRQRKIRFLALVMVCIMALEWVPVTALAASGSWYGSCHGTGSRLDGESDSYHYYDDSTLVSKLFRCPAWKKEKNKNLKNLLPSVFSGRINKRPKQMLRNTK